jgi:hypothetical protein
MLVKAGRVSGVAFLMRHRIAGRWQDGASGVKQRHPKLIVQENIKEAIVDCQA